jgi:hypothetical protein
MAGPVRENMDTASSGGPFDGFAASDFDAYDQKKWTSKKYNLERRRAKDKLLALARGAREKLQDELGNLDLHATDESPGVSNGHKVEAQHAFYVRNAEDQRAIRALVNTTNLQAGAALFDIGLMHQHACLVIGIDFGGLRFGLEIAGRAKVDRDNAGEKLKQAWARERLVELSRGLPARAEVGFEQDAHDAAALKAGSVEPWVDRFSKTQDSFRAQHAIARSDPRLANASAIALAEESLRAYVPLFRFLAWARDNEHKQVKEAIKKTVDERQKKAAPAFQAGDRVTILTGLFAGRGGYLSEIDAKGRAKVMVGPVSVTVEVKDLKAS